MEGPLKVILLPSLGIQLAIADLVEVSEALVICCRPRDVGSAGGGGQSEGCTLDSWSKHLEF